MKIFRNTISSAVVIATLITLLPPLSRNVSATAIEHYENYGTITNLYNKNGCTGMQGMTVDEQYLYNVKVNSATEASAYIARTDKDSGSTVYLTDSSTGSAYFSYLSHANDLELDTIAGVETMFIATCTEDNYSLVRMVLDGTTLTKVGNYSTIYNGNNTAISSAKVLSKNSEEITLLIKKGKYLYTTKLGVYDTSGALELTHVFTLDTANVTINGVCMDLSDYLGQGFDYIDGKIYVPMACADPMNMGCIAVYNIEGASGTIQNDPTLSFWLESSTYAEKFELESCAICPSDGILYFNTNRAITSSDADYDAIHYVKDYVYDPGRGTTTPQRYRWELISDQFSSVTDGGCIWNNALHHAGDIQNGTFTDVEYALSKPVILQHDVPWIVEWKSTGAWTTGSLLFSARSISRTEGNTYLFRRKDSSLIALGEFSGNKFYNYGITLSDYGIDGTQTHVYSLRNEFESDGSNMVYLYVDGKKLGAMNNYHLAGSSQGTTSNWVSGKDFTFSYMGTSEHPLSECDIEYVQVWGNGILDQVDDANIYRWESQSSGFNSLSDFGYTENSAELLSGSYSSGSFSDCQYRLSEPVTLLHDRPWSIEWQSEGAWGSGALLLAGAQHSKTTNSPILYRRQNSSLIGFGMYDGNQFNNSGIQLSDYGIDGTVSHIYRLTNRVESDGSNMVYLYVDGNEIGAMDNYFIGGSAQGTKTDWLNGQDLVFSYIGTYQQPVSDCFMAYLQIWEDGIPSEDTPNHYLWETQNNRLTGISSAPYTLNEAGILSGEIIGESYSGSSFVLDKQIVLLHNRPWSIEWKSDGTWKDSANGTLLLSSSKNGVTADMMYLYRRGASEIIAFGERLNNKHHNYGVKLSDHGIDGTASHVYRLENQINSNGTNMAYLYVDDVLIGPMDNYYIGGVAQGTTSDWISGKDFVFSYLGTDDFTIGNCNLSYLQINEGEMPTGTVQFLDWDGTVITSEVYQYGETVTAPTSPVRQADNTYTYTFTGWDKPITDCTGDAVYKALYTPTYIDYLVEFRDWDGTVISQETYHYGDIISPPDEPTREDDENYTYSFAGWTPEVTVCSGNAVYTAVYTQTDKPRPEIVAKTFSLSFEDEVLINVYFTLNNQGNIQTSDMGLLTWTTPQESGTIEDAETTIPGAVVHSASGYFCVSTTGIPAKKMGDTVYFKIFVQCEDGSYEYSKLYSYSPKNYAYNILNGNYSTSLKALVVSMLNYGAQAQVYFDYKPYDLMNADLTAEQQALVADYDRSMVQSLTFADSSKVGVFANNGGCLKRTPSVSFDGAFALNFYMSPAYPVDGNMIMYCWDADTYFACEELTPENATAITTTPDGDYYLGAIKDIAAKNLDKPFYVAVVYTSDGIRYCSGVVTYSIGMYCVSQASQNSAMSPFAQATTVYGYYAKEYFYN